MKDILYTTKPKNWQLSCATTPGAPICQFFRLFAYTLSLTTLLFFFGCSPKPIQRALPVISSLPERIEKPAPLIILDPGHGGDDDGTKSLKKPIYREKGFNLSLARLVDQYLKELGYRTYLTRTEDLFIPLKTRAIKANQLSGDLFVSLHFNAAKSPSAHGVEIFYPDTKKDPERIAFSKKVAGFVLENILMETGAHSRGIKAGNFCVIRETTMPAILVESGFLTNKEELEKILHEPDYLKKIAWGIAQGIQQSLPTKSSQSK